MLRGGFASGPALKADSAVETYQSSHSQLRDEKGTRTEDHHDREKVARAPKERRASIRCPGKLSTQLKRHRKQGDSTDSYKCGKGKQSGGVVWAN